MTTIAYKDGIMAADGRESMADHGESDGYVVRDDCKKVFRLPDGSLFGGRGVSEQIAMVMDRMVEGRKPPKFDYDECDCECLMVKPDGTMWLYEGKKFRLIEDMSFYAIGSGARYAFACFKASGDAKEAAAMGASMDIWSGGKIHWLGLNPKHDGPKPALPAEPDQKRA